MDSKLVVEQMSGRWKVKHPDLKSLHRAGDGAGVEVRPHQLRVDSAGRELACRPTGQRGDGRGGRTGEARSRESSNSRSAETPVSPAGWTGARGAPTRFLLLRHGQTELSVQRRYSGRGNPALTDVGRRQAEAAAQYLGAAGRHRGGHHVAAAACLRHRGEGRQGARSRRHRRRRSDRDGLRRVGGADVLRGRRTRSRSCTGAGCATPASPRPDGESFDSVARPGAARARRGSSPSTRARPCWWCRT